MNGHTMFSVGLIVVLIGALLGMGPVASAQMGLPITASNVDTDRHYRASVPTPSTSVVSVINAAQGQGYWVRIQTGQDVTYLQGSQPCTTCSPSQESEFFEPPQLIVDGQAFWIRLDEPQWRVNLRPAVQTAGYELIVSPKLPKTSLSADDVDAIRETLAPLNVLSEQTSSLQLETMVQSGKPTPPEGVRIDSVLYGLTQAPDWTEYAQQHGISLSGLRADVIVELASADASLPEGIDLAAVSRSGSLVSAQARIDQLISLASAPSVAFVRLPSRPQPATQ